MATRKEKIDYYIGGQDEHLTDSQRKVCLDVLKSIGPKGAVALAKRAKEVTDAEVLPGEFYIGKYLKNKKREAADFINHKLGQIRFKHRHDELDFVDKNGHADLSN